MSSDSMFDDIDWNPNINKAIIWFGDLINDAEYEMVLHEGWAQELRKKYKQLQDIPGTTSLDVNLHAVTMNTWKLKGKTIPAGMEIEFSVWTSIYKQWNKCYKAKPIKEDQPVFMKIYKESKKVWSIHELRNYVPRAVQKARDEDII